MREMGLEVRAAVAVARKELRHISRYPIDFAATVFLPIFQFLLPTLLLGATFLVAGRPAGFLRTTGTTDVAGYFVLGAVVSGLTFGAFWGASFAFRREMMNGTLEPLWLVPARRHTIVAGYAIAYTGISLASALSLFTVGAILFRTFPWRALLLLIPLALLLEVAMLGVTYAVTAAVLVVREPNVLVDVGAYVFQALSGVMFPVAMLPLALAWLSLLLPATYALDLLRTAGLDTRPLAAPAAELAALFALAAALVPVGAFTFALADRRLRRRGTLGSY